ncbi:bifunctional adenosylcobinamide kinase/adenosylcobinamide-phosphate guanylyltransferase [bacterium]|nr:bifunctional adenosylcobinamide kinase/adenosylcobinamide-phosphate guanylyltransferase [bacterium]
MGNTKVVLITGGARSGKSRMALELASGHSPRIFLATAEALDQEMKDRIRKHQLDRGDDWITLEEPVFLAQTLERRSTGTMVVDCITLWLSNLLMRSYNRQQIETEVARLVEALQARASTTIVVTNEVGMGIVPENDSGRLFRDLAGIANQRIAEVADRVIFMVSGLPFQLK